MFSAQNSNFNKSLHFCFHSLLLTPLSLPQRPSLLTHEGEISEEAQRGVPILVVDERSRVRESSSASSPSCPRCCGPSSTMAYPSPSSRSSSFSLDRGWRPQPWRLQGWRRKDEIVAGVAMWLGVVVLRL